MSPLTCTVRGARKAEPEPVLATTETAPASFRGSVSPMGQESTLVSPHAEQRPQERTEESLTFLLYWWQALTPHRCAAGEQPWTAKEAAQESATHMIFKNEFHVGESPWRKGDVVAKVCLLQHRHFEVLEGAEAENAPIKLTFATKYYLTHARHRKHHKWAPPTGPAFFWGEGPISNQWYITGPSCPPPNDTHASRIHHTRRQHAQQGSDANPTRALRDVSVASTLAAVHAAVALATH